MIDLRQGDCLEIMNEIPEKSVDLILTDSPYGFGYQSNMKKTKIYLCSMIETQVG